MDQTTQTTLTNLDSWKRGLFMIVFAIISGVAKLIVTLVAVFQFVTLLFKGQANAAVIPLGQNLSTYLYQITLFLTFKTEEMPFPFLSFPDGPPEAVLNEESAETKPTTEATVKNDEETVDVADEDEKNQIGEEKDKKNDSL
jgi:hypothetical protein